MSGFFSSRRTQPNEGSGIRRISSDPAPAPRPAPVSVPTVDASIQRDTFVPGIPAGGGIPQAQDSTVVPMRPAAESERQHITAESQVPKWRSFIQGVVREADRERCVVLDLEFSTVLVLGTPEFYASGAYNGLTIGITNKSLSIEKAVSTTPEVIQKLIQINDQRSSRSSGSVAIKDEDRHLALYNDLVKGAFAIKASDLHFEIDTSAPRSHVRLRLYGRMRDWKTFETKQLTDAVAAAFNAMSKKGTASGASWTQDRSLSTMTEHTIKDTKVNGRFSTYPVITGIDVVVRLLESDPRAVRVATLEELGYSQTQIEEQLHNALGRNSGLIAVAGMTGSGKSTTLKTLMDLLPNKHQLKRYSVEDPVEYIMPGVRQFSIQRGSDDKEEDVRRKFLSALRMLVRMDPDAVMIGEIRDKESGDIAAEMVQTGHRVLTTVHGDGAIDVLSRLTGRGINMPAEMLATRKFLSAVMYQRLMPVLCPHCRIPAARILPAPKLATLREKFKLDTNTMYCAHDAGCEHCRVDGINSGGTNGLTVAAEIAVPNAELLTFIGEKNWIGAEKAWRQTRRTHFGSPDMTGKTAFEHALYKASIGMVDPRDIEKDFEPLESYEIYPGASNA